MINVLDVIFLISGNTQVLCKALHSGMPTTWTVVGNLKKTHQNNPYHSTKIGKYLNKITILSMWESSLVFFSCVSMQMEQGASNLH